VRAVDRRLVRTRNAVRHQFYRDAQVRGHRRGELRRDVPRAVGYARGVCPSRLDAPPPRPTRAALLAAAGRSIPDLIAPGLDVLFCGINPGLYSGATGLHFARPGNRFWRALYAGGLTPTLLQPWQQQALLDARLGITNLVMRTTATAAELADDELRAGRQALERKVRRYRPLVLALVGIGAYRVGFGRPKATVGRQPEAIGDTIVWVLPNPSGLNANYQPADFAAAFGELATAVRACRDR
jgi:double-stranded uracil-DNA glycosylase